MKFDDFKITTRIRKINLWIQILLGATLYLGLNFLAARHYMRIDVSANHKNSLSPESVAYIKNLKMPIDIYVVVSTRNFANENTAVVKELDSFLRQYEYESLSPNRIRVHKVNSNLENLKAEALTKRFGAGIENSVIVAGKTRFKVVPISDFYSADGEASKAFNGESLMTSALLNASEERQPKLYFLRGHGEADYKNTNPIYGISEFARALETRNYKLADLSLADGSPFPTDADKIGRAHV